MNNSDTEILRYIAITISITTIASLINKKLGIYISYIVFIIFWIIGILVVIAGGWGILFETFVILPLSALIGFLLGNLIRRLFVIIRKFI